MPKRTIKSQIAWCARAHWVLSILMGVLLVSFILFGWRPAWSRQRQLRTEIDAAARVLDTNQSRASNMSVLMREVARLQSQLARFNKKLPRTAELGEFIREITQVSQQCALYKLVHQPGQIRRLELYSEVPITMNFEGNFNDVFLFLRQMEQMQRLARVKNITVRTRDTKLGTVDVSMAMNIYFSEL